LAIDSHDHEPPHVHVVGDGEMKILLGDDDSDPVVVYSRGMKFGDAKKALEAVTESKAWLLDEWRRIHD
jgi:hypothetical protein